VSDAAQAAVDFAATMRAVGPKVGYVIDVYDYLKDPRGLAARIKAFWRREGFDVEVWIERDRDVRSSLRNGLPI
jgi:hypothetical protein